MNRRQFTKSSALALAATRLPSFAQSTAAEKPIGFAAVGLGTISDIFMRACANSKSAKITALVTGHPQEKGLKYAAMYGIPKTSIYTYEQYERLGDNKNVDAVYIGLPNSMHCEYTVRAARLNKHVLCEKPMAISSAECRTMIQECRQANVRLMIAYRIQYDPTWLQAMQIIDSGGIGDVQSFQGGFFNQQRAGAWRLSRDARRRWLGAGSRHLPTQRHPSHHARGTRQLRRNGIHPRFQRPLCRGRTVSRVDDETSLRHPRLLRAAPTGRMAPASSSLRREGLSPV